MFETQELIDVLRGIVEIDSANSYLIADGPGERNVQKEIQRYLAELGVESVLERIDDSHCNLVATIPGTGGGKSITLYAHADTVGYELWKDRALHLEVFPDKLMGLGAADDKGHCAVMMLLAKILKRENIRLKGDVHLVFIADEEGESCGAFDYVKKHRPEAALILEPAPLDQLNVTHQGFGWLKIKVYGKAAHGSAPDQGVDAIAMMGEVIVRMSRNQRENFAKNVHPLNGETVYHTGVISGGTDYASYPAYCELGIEIGTQPGETMQCRYDEIQAIFDEVKELYPSFRGEIEPVVVRDPFVSRGSEEMIRMLKEEVRKETGTEPACTGDNSWGDAQIFQDAGFPTVGIGALGENYHAPDEWVDLQQLQQLCRIVVNFVTKYCEKSQQ